jgi:hypothetical protein
MKRVVDIDYTPQNRNQNVSKKVNQEMSNKQNSPKSRPKSASAPTSASQKSSSRNIVSASSKRPRDTSPQRINSNQLKESPKKTNFQKDCSSKGAAKEVWIQDDVDNIPVPQTIVNVPESPNYRKSPQKFSLAALAKQIVHNGLIRWLYRVRRRKVLEKRRIAAFVAMTMTPSKLFLIIKIQKKVRELMKRDERGFTVYRRRLMKYRAVFLIQKHARRWLACSFVYRYIKASIVIKRIWLKYRGDRILRQNLRRVQIPLTITLHNLQNIPSHVVRFEEIKVKISLWDHYLLHIVRDSDLLTIINSKEPRITYYTDVFPVQANLSPQAVNQVQRISVFAVQSPKSVQSPSASSALNRVSSKTSLTSLKEIIQAEDVDDDEDGDSEDDGENEENDNGDDDDDDDEEEDDIDNNIPMSRRGPKKSVVAKLLTSSFSRFSFYKKSDPNLLAQNVNMSHVNFGDFKLKIPGNNLYLYINISTFN